MSPPVSDFAVLRRSMQPVLHDGVCTYCVAPPEADVLALSPVATVAEAQGLSLVLPERQAVDAGLAALEALQRESPP